jgi:UDP-GlcNAc:undecaprenyl-phosphate GlcNAc-1-phosphate transferase
MRLMIASLSAFLLALSLTPLARAAARAAGIVAVPRRDRWHRRPTALLGGVAIYLACLAGYLIFAPRFPGARLILGAGTLLFILGLIDDLRRIKPHIKLIAQLVVAALVVYFGRRLPWMNYEALNVFITIFWLVGITNAINLLDNMDGLAGGIAALACAFLVITFSLNGQPEQALLPALLGGAALGFLVFNFHPASIFMGDGGSMFLGFVLGSTALLSDYGRTRNLGAVLLVPVLILLIPIFDTCLVTATRKLSGRPISQGGRDHTSHRLVALGMSERRAVLLLYAFAACSGALALAVRWLKTEELLWLIPSFALVVIFVGLHLGKVRLYEEGQPPPGNTIINALVDFSYKRRVFEILLDVGLVALAYYGAYLLRFDGSMPAAQMTIFIKTLPLVIAIQMLCGLLGGLYRRLWRYVGIADLVVMAKSVLAGAAASAMLALAMYGWQQPSRAVLVLYPLLLLFFVSASRLSFRLLRALLGGHPQIQSGARPVVIYGAGDGGELLLRELLNNPEHGCAPVGFIDDDRRKVGKLIHGYRIFNSSELLKLMHSYSVREVLIATAKVPEHRLAQLRRQGVSLRRMSLRLESVSGERAELPAELPSAMNF